MTTKFLQNKQRTMIMKKFVYCQSVEFIASSFAPVESFAIRQKMIKKSKSRNFIIQWLGCPNILIKILR